MVNCAVYNCNSNNKKQKSGGSEVELVKFFRFPKTQIYQKYGNKSAVERTSSS